MNVGMVIVLHTFVALPHTDNNRTHAPKYFSFPQTKLVCSKLVHQIVPAETLATALSLLL